MEFIKHSTQPQFREIVQNAKGDLIVALGIVPKIYVIRLINQTPVKVSEIPAYPLALAVSDSGQYIAYVSASAVVLYDTNSKQSVATSLPVVADTISVNDAGEIVAMLQSSIDGTAYKVVAGVASTISFGELTGRKVVVHGATTKVADAKRYGTPGSLTTATDLIIGFYGTHVVVADGKVIGLSTIDVGEPILESTNCGRYIVVRTPTKYVSITKATMAISSLPNTSLAPVVIPRRIAVGSSLKAHTGEQVTVTQGSGTLTIAGPDTWISKFKVIVINDTTFNVLFVAGSVEVTTDILATEIKQIYFSDSEFANPTETLAYAAVLQAVKKPLAISEYGFVTTNELAGDSHPDMTKSVPKPTEYIYLNRTPLMDTRSLVATKRVVSFTEYAENQ